MVQPKASFFLNVPRDGDLTRGSTGRGVRAVQWALTRAGVPTTIDGDFGPLTERAVREFQAANGLFVDGVVGPVTWAALGLLPDGRPPRKKSAAQKSAARKKRAAMKKAAKKRTPDEQPARKKQRAGAEKRAKKRAGAVRRGALAAARAAHRAGFDGRDLATITMIAGRESGWRSDAVNPNTSDRGMWQINWHNLQRDAYADLRSRLRIRSDADLLDLDTNAAVARHLYEDSVEFGEPWFPWRGSERGRDGSGPGWDPNGSHRWRTEPFAAEARAAATAVEEGVAGGVDPTSPGGRRRQRRGSSRSTYTVTTDDSDGFIAVVGRAMGITAGPFGLRLSAAEAVAEHNDVTLDAVWRPGDEVRFPGEIRGVRSHRVKRGDTVADVAQGLGLRSGAAAKRRVRSINAWQGGRPRAGQTWYGGAV